ncbi:superoxide dismutase family protein [Sphingobium sp. AN558]|uniref:superoxide dismutase family protein n=1 Tax=Sphingobium sp. AN558 TaxID=3133442 RepID=UPI0030BABD0E
MRIAPIFLSLPLLLAAGGCATTAQPAAGPSASAQLSGSDGASHGSATIVQAEDGLHVTVMATGLTPGVHAVHLHMIGLCSPPDFASAGGHWNPTGHKHGKDNPAGMHMGDMPNMLAAVDGTGRLDYVIPDGQLAAGATPLLDADGAAVVVHAKPDDNVSDPAGNAGGRVACGVLKVQ